MIRSKVWLGQIFKLLMSLPPCWRRVFILERFISRLDLLCVDVNRTSFDAFVDTCLCVGKTFSNVFFLCFFQHVFGVSKTPNSCSDLLFFLPVALIFFNKMEFYRRILDFLIRKKILFWFISFEFEFYLTPNFKMLHFYSSILSFYLVSRFC